MILTPTQFQAVHAPGSLAVHAGAGSGKTRVITERIIYLLDTGVPPASILAVTFTDLAANELRSRIQRAAQDRQAKDLRWAAILPSLPLLQVCTLHSLCARIARTHPVESGAGLGYEILEPSDAELWRAQHLPRVLASLPPEVVAAVPGRLRTPLLHTLLDDPLRAERAAELNLADGPDVTTQAALTLYGLVRNQLDTLKTELELATFADLEVLAWTALQFPQVRAHYQERWAHIIVDELQDTAPQQWAMVQALTGEQTTLAVVGDAKQSIYGFRGAEPGVFEQATQAALARGGQVLSMHESFRSHPQLTDTVNSVMAQLMPGPGPQRPSATPFEPLVAARPLPPVDSTAHVRSPVELHLVQGGSAATRAQSVARVVAGRLQALIGSPVLDQASGQWRPAQLGDMALLVRSRKDLQHYEQALREAELPYAVHGGVGLYQRPEVREAVTLLRALADPADDLLLCALLRGPYLGWSETGILELAQSRTGGSLSGALRGSLAAAPAQASAQITAWREKSAVTSVSGLLTLIDEQTGALAGHAAQPDGRRRVANLRLFHALLRRWAQSGTRDLIQVARRLGQLQRLGAKEGEAPAAQPSAVQIMTVHASKGLEFPIVFYPDALRHGMPPASRVRLDRQAGLVLQSAEAERKRQTADALREAETSEAERINYVAFTRARDHLVLVASAADTPKQTSALRSFAAAFPIGVPRAYYAADEVPSSPPLALTPLAGTGRLTLNFTPSPGLTLPSRLPVTSLTTYARCPRQFMYRYLAGYLPLARLWEDAGAAECDGISSGQGRRAAGRTIGDAVHKAIEQGWQAREIARHCAALTLQEQAEVLELAGKLQAPAFAALQGYTYRRELPLTHRLGALTLVGVADAVDTERGVLVDYKTDRLMTPQDYLPQLATYARHFGTEQAALAYLRHDTLHWFGPQELEEGYEQVETLVSRMQARDFGATSSPDTCRNCVFAGVCDQARVNCG